jgi:hypothetical protein
VQVGSIIEYRYKVHMGGFFVYSSQWLLNDELFTKRALFTLRKNSYLPIVWSWPLGLPRGATVPENKGSTIRMALTDVPAFVTEDFMPPESALKFRVEFNYSNENPDKDAASYWKRYGKAQWHRADQFIDHRRAMAKALAQIISGDEPADIRLQKIYTRVQQLRNLSFEPPRTDTERERDKISGNDDAADVWERGYGDGDQITWLFVALARAAGLQADLVRVSTRDDTFFDPDMRGGNSLYTSVVRVTIGEREIWADPGTRFAPIGLLPWNETGVTGLLLTQDGGIWVKTPLPDQMASRLERRASFDLGEDGALEGKVTVSYYGLQALTRRIAMRNDDEAARREALENEIKRFVPVGISVTLTNRPDWESSSGAMRAEFDLTIPGWASRAGGRLLMLDAVFQANEKGMFPHAERIQPIYFDYPYSHDDDVTVKLPAGYEPMSLPEPSSAQMGVLKYNNIVTYADGVMRSRRHVEIGGMLFSPKSAGGLHKFFESVRTADEQHSVFSRSKSAAAH